MLHDHLSPLLASLAVAVVTTAQSVVVPESALFSPFTTMIVSGVVSFTVIRVTVRFLEKDVGALAKDLQDLRKDLASTREDQARMQGMLDRHE